MENKRSKVFTVTTLGNLRPEHFKDESNYRVVPKFLEKHKKMSNQYRQKTFKLNKKVQNLKDLLSKLHEKGLISKNAADDSKVRSETFQ